MLDKSPVLFSCSPLPRGESVAGGHQSRELPVAYPAASSVSGTIRAFRIRQRTKSDSGQTKSAQDAFPFRIVGRAKECLCRENLPIHIDFITAGFDKFFGYSLGAFHITHCDRGSYGVTITARTRVAHRDSVTQNRLVAP